MGYIWYSLQMGKKYDLEVQSTIIVALVNFFLINSKYVDAVFQQIILVEKDCSQR